MILDKNMQVSTAQVVTGSPGSTDVLDLKQDRDIGIGDPVYLVTTMSAVSGTAPTLQVTIQTDDVAGFGTGVNLAASAVVPASPSQMIVVVLPRTNKRYLRAVFTAGGTSPSITVDSYFTTNPPPGWQAYPGAIPG